MLSPRRAAIIVRIIAVLAAWSAPADCRRVFAEPPPAARIDFTRDIRPILSDNCFYCHGPDPKHREADLRLDTREGALSVLTPGNSAASEFVNRITSSDPDEQMPPPRSNKHLSPEQIALLRLWIEQDAPWGEHWAFRPLVSPAQPPGEGSPIDVLVAAGLARQGLTPAPEADRQTLIRRVTLDLTGLPPTPEEVDAFVADPDAAAYEKLVDRLLASPAYGERMAWDWLDAARYADSNGYQGDAERTMWPWRDWVVEAFNRNLPFDQFTVWQLAGDLLPDASFEQRLATGFCRNHAINGEGGRIAEENRVDYAMDMSETMGTVWLGLTLNCCRCHDHKFDPLRQTDYYQLLAFFNQTPVDGSGGDPQAAPALAAPTAAEKTQLAAAEQTLTDASATLERRAAELLPGQSQWERQWAALETAWTRLTPSDLKAEHQDLAAQADGTILASGPNADNDTYTITAPVALDRLTALSLEALRHPTMTSGGLARSDSGNFVLTEVEVTLRRPGAEPVPLKILTAEATFEQQGLTIGQTFDGQPDSGWAVYENGPVNREHRAVFHFEPIEAGPGSTLTVTLHHNSVHKHHNLGYFRLSVTDQPAAKLSPGGLLAIDLSLAPEQRTPEQAARIRTAFLDSDQNYRQLTSNRRQASESLDRLRATFAKVMVMADRADQRKTFVLNRGIYSQPQQEVSAGTPASLVPMPGDAPRNRLGLARWLTSREQPLVARVTVNRFWQQVFGVGLVKTVEDFGSQAEMPRYLELLDWLAADFRDSGWDVKRLLRVMVTSRTYRQSSQDRGPQAGHDPANRWLARGARYRLPSWMLRDQALAASGLLTRRQGGPPVKGYQPAGVWEEATFGAKQYVQDHGEALYRRSLYTFWRRITAPTEFFDNASRETCTVKVFRTNTPLQALLTLNDTTFVEAARALAQRVLEGPDPAPAARLDEVFRRLLARRASDAERTILLAGVDRSREEFRAQPAAAAALLAVGESPRSAALDPAEHAAWTALALAVLNLDETLNKE